MQQSITELRLRNKKNIRLGEILFLFLFICSFYLQAQETKKLVILHHNDTHSRIEPLPENASKYPNMGGVIRQNAYVEEVRKENKNMLLFHCGDFVQGTPYFNLFKGQAEIACMNFMKYDAACLGNHEFDYGLEILANMVKAAQFPIITTNLDFTGTVLEGLTKKYLILHRNGLTIGIIGLTISPKGLVAQANYKGMKYLDPIHSANETAAYLKEKAGCDLVICLSHLGYFPAEDRVGDITLAKESRNIDIILGGHTHTFLRFADRRLNLDGNEVIINQVGDRGIYMGRLDVVMEKKTEQ
jgi:5'-nucleotidase